MQWWYRVNEWCAGRYHFPIIPLYYWLLRHFFFHGSFYRRVSTTSQQDAPVSVLIPVIFLFSFSRHVGSQSSACRQFLLFLFFPFSLFLGCYQMIWHGDISLFSSWTQFVGGRPEKRWEAFPLPTDDRRGRKRALIIEIAYTRVPQKYSTCSSSSSNLVYRYITIANRSEGRECDGPAKRTKKKKQI